MAFPANRPRNDTQIIRGPQGVPGKDADPLDLIAGITDGQVPARVAGQLVGIDILTPEDLAAVEVTANNAIPLDQKNTAGGVAGLDGSGHITTAAFPPTVASGATLADATPGQVPVKNADGTWHPGTPSGGGAGGHVIQDEGTARPARAALNFVGQDVAATDDAGNGRTNVTVRRSAFRGVFEPNTAYLANDVIVQGGQLRSPKTPFTTGSAFNAADWDIVGVSPGLLPGKIDVHGHSYATTAATSGQKGAIAVLSEAPMRATLPIYTAVGGSALVSPSDTPGPDTYGGGGWAAIEQAMTFPARAAAPYLSNRFAGLLWHGINDYALIGAAQMQTSFKHAVRTVIRRHRLAALYEDATNGTRSGSGGTTTSGSDWTTVTDTASFTATTTSGSPTLTGVSSFTNLGRGNKITGTGIPANTSILATDTGAGTVTMSANATASASITVASSFFVGKRGSGTSFQTSTVTNANITVSTYAHFEGGKVTVGLQASPGSTLLVELSVDGNVVETLDTTGIGVPTTIAGGRTVAFSMQTAALTAGAHAIKTRIVSGAGTLTFDWWGVEAPDPRSKPPFLLVGACKMPNYAGHASSFPNAPLNDAKIADLNQLLSDVAAEFDSKVAFVPIDDVVNPSGIPQAAAFNADGVHPNGYGNGLIAGRIADAFAAMRLSSTDLSLIGQP